MDDDLAAVVCTQKLLILALEFNSAQVIDNGSGMCKAGCMYSLHFLGSESLLVSSDLFSVAGTMSVFFDISMTDMDRTLR